MKKVKPDMLFNSMMLANALFTLAALLGAFSGKFNSLIPFVIIAMTLAFVNFGVFFFKNIKSFGTWIKLSGVVYVVASCVLGLVLSVMSAVVLPSDNSFQETIKLLGLFIIPLGVVLFASFYQTYFAVANRAGSLKIGLAYLALLSIAMVFSAFIGNTFSANLGLTTLLVCLVVLLIKRKAMLTKKKSTSRRSK